MDKRPIQRKVQMILAQKPKPKSTIIHRIVEVLDRFDKRIDTAMKTIHA